MQSLIKLALERYIILVAHYNCVSVLSFSISFTGMKHPLSVFDIEDGA